MHEQFTKTCKAQLKRMQSFKEKGLKIKHREMGHLANLLLKEPDSDKTMDDRSDCGAKRRKLSYGDIDVKQKIEQFEGQIEVSSVASGWDDALIQSNKNCIDEFQFRLPHAKKPYRQSLFGRKYATEIRRCEDDDLEDGSF